MINKLIMEVIKSINVNQRQILLDILKLYHIEKIDLDFTYSSGNFYKAFKDKGKQEVSVPEPLIKMDVYPKTDDTIKIEKLKSLPLNDASCNCIVYDPPFVISPHNSPSMLNDDKDSCIIQKRFSCLYPLSELLETYYFHMKEMYRLLKEDGIAIVKCQNTISSRKQINSPEYLWLCGESIGFDMLDKFILVSKNRIISSKHKKQQHSRRFESYFLVFKKSQKLKPKYLINEDFAHELIEGFINHNIKK